jgi:hypothetical protein
MRAKVQDIYQQALDAARADGVDDLEVTVERLGAR